MSRSLGRNVCQSAVALLVLILSAPTSSHAYPTWEQYVAGGQTPGPRQQHAAIFDPVGGRMIVFGGENVSDGTWAFSPDSLNYWRILGVGSPGRRQGASAVYDSRRHRMILFGGYNGTWLHDVWTLPLDPLGTWTELHPTGNPPANRMLTPIVYDPVRDQVLFFGGWLGEGPTNDTWALSLSGTPAWTQLPSAGPVPRYGHLAFYDPVGDQLVMLMGRSGSSGNLNDVWVLPLATATQWIRIAPSGAAPIGRQYSAGAYVPELGSFFFYGGTGDATQTELWSLDMTGDPKWTSYANFGTIPPPLYLHSLVYDPYRQLIEAYGPAPAITTVFGLRVGDGGAPFIGGLSVDGARVGDPLQIRGAALEQVDTVRFAGDATAAIEQRTFNAIDVHVPAGALTGPITVSGSAGSFTSAQSFFVGDVPVVDRAEPDSGRTGDVILLHGRQFTRTSRVAFGAASHATFTLSGDTLITAIVDPLAASGPIAVTNPVGTGTSPFPFQVILPIANARIASVRDIRGDQGGQVAVKWVGSDFDIPGRAGIDRYRVWRRAPLESAIARASQRLRAGPPGYWENVGEVPAIRIRGYAFTASTPTDSSADGNPYTAFFVETVTDTPGVFYLSAVDSGYSVDNLAPLVPSQFRADYSGSGNVLHWAFGHESDLGEFRLFRGARVDFPLDAEHLLLSTRDTTTTDAPGAWYYKLVAVDVHGNSSRPALVTPDGTVATLAALVASDVSPDRVSLTWYAEGLQGAALAVERSEATGVWRMVAMRSVDGEGYLRYDDVNVEPGTTYGYRLVYTEAGAEYRTAETRVLVPGLSLAIEGVTPNPATRRELRVAFRLAVSGPGLLEVLDVSGRRMASQRFEPGLSNRGTWQLPSGARWPAGIYLVRLTQGAEVRMARFALVE